MHNRSRRFFFPFNRASRGLASSRRQRLLRAGRHHRPPCLSANTPYDASTSSANIPNSPSASRVMNFGCNPNVFKYVCPETSTSILDPSNVVSNKNVWSRISFESIAPHAYRYTLAHWTHCIALGTEPMLTRKPPNMLERRRTNVQTKLATAEDDVAIEMNPHSAVVAATKSCRTPKNTKNASTSSLRPIM
eukprot:31194-Pelagococcus_subviridis.AAC.4